MPEPGLFRGPDHGGDRTAAARPHRHGEELGAPQPAPAERLPRAMKYENPELRDRLAAEYALGTLRGAARRRFQRLMKDDPALRDLTLQWEMRLNDMAASVKPVAPRPQVWQAIDRALGPVPRPQHER